MFDYAWKNILKRPGRSLLTLIGVTVMITLIVTITGIVNVQKARMHQHASASIGKLHVQPRLAGSTYPASGIDLPGETAGRILSLTHARLQERLSSAVLYFALQAPPYPNSPPALLLVGIEPGREESFTGSIANDVRPVEGVEFLTETQEAWPVIAGSAAAALLFPDLHAGDSVKILEQPFTVVGILESSPDQVVNSAVIVPLPLAQKLLEKQGFVSALILTQERVGAEQEITTLIQQAYPTMQVIDPNTLRRNLNDGIKIFENMINVISLVVTGCAAILISAVMLITTKERRREFGVLRALGAPASSIVRSVFWEIFLLSAAGCLLGGLIAGLVMRFALPENIFDLGHILAYMPLALALTLASGVLPTFQINRIQPVEALRYE